MFVIDIEYTVHVAHSITQLFYEHNIETMYTSDEMHDNMKSVLQIYYKVWLQTFNVKLIKRP